MKPAGGLRAPGFRLRLDNPHTMAISVLFPIRGIGMTRLWGPDDLWSPFAIGVRSEE